MRIFLTGVSCVGKSTIGERLATLLNITFFDLDTEVERYYGTSIERLQQRFLTMYSFRKAASEALVSVLARPESSNCVIALTPSGLMSPYLQIVRKAGGVKVVLLDTPENILARETFYDIDSRLIAKALTKRELALHLREIKKDIAHFGKSFCHADFQIDISGMDAESAALTLKERLPI